MPEGKPENNPFTYATAAVLLLHNAINFVSISQSAKNGNRVGITALAQSSNEVDTEALTVFPKAENNSTVMITRTVISLLFNLFTVINMQGTSRFCIIFYKGEI